MTENFESPNHALTAGMVWGLLMRYGIDAIPEVDSQGNYTDVIQIAYDEKVYRLQVLPREVDADE